MVWNGTEGFPVLAAAADGTLVGEPRAATECTVTTLDEL